MTHDKKDYDIRVVDKEGKTRHIETVVGRYALNERLQTLLDGLQDRETIMVHQWPEEQPD